MSGFLALPGAVIHIARPGAVENGAIDVPRALRQRMRPFRTHEDSGIHGQAKLVIFLIVGEDLRKAAPIYHRR
jgi:hypothetical protein